MTLLSFLIVLSFDVSEYISLLWNFVWDFPIIYMRLSEQKSVIRLTPIDLTILRWLHTDWNTLENGVSVAFGFGVEVLELRASEGGGRIY